MKIKTKAGATEKLLFCSYFTNKSLLHTYKHVTFRSLWNKKFNSLPKQWTSPIKIYIESDFPKSVIVQFKEFIKEFENIKNLQISFVDKIQDANYLIKNTNENLLPKNKKFKTELERDEYYSSNIGYHMLGDNNKKYYTGIIKINIENILDKTLILKKLKQRFFLSLGNFHSFSNEYDYTLLSQKYNNSIFLNPVDLNILKLHYFIIYKNIENNEDTFNRLKEIAITECSK